MAAINKKTIAALLAGTVALIIAGVFLQYSQKKYYQGSFPLKYSAEIEKYCSEYDVPLSLVYAVVRTESSFKPEVVSTIGARGLMQITEETFQWIKGKLEPTAATTYDDMFVPETNIRYGVCLLSLLLKEFDTVENALCAYHAGWGNTKNWLQSEEYSKEGQIHTIPFADTRAYVDKVKKTSDTYKSLYGFST